MDPHRLAGFAARCVRDAGLKATAVHRIMAGDRAAVAAAIGGCRAAELFRGKLGLSMVLRQASKAEEAALLVGLSKGGAKKAAAPKAAAQSDAGDTQPAKRARVDTAANRAKLDPPPEMARVDSGTDPLEDALCIAVDLREPKRAGGEDQAKGGNKKRRKTTGRGRGRQARGGAGRGGVAPGARRGGVAPGAGRDGVAPGARRDGAVAGAGRGGVVPGARRGGAVAGAGRKRGRREAGVRDQSNKAASSSGNVEV